MAQHTPGPWRHNGLKEPYSTEGKDKTEWLACAVWAKDKAADIEDIPICTCAFSVGKYNEVDPETQHANAVLISAAPDLLNAARLALAILEHKSKTCRNSAWKCSDQRAFDALTAAIAKAEGK